MSDATFLPFAFTLQLAEDRFSGPVTASSPTGASSSSAKRTPARDDFILVSEFSEHEGPIPLFSLPESALLDPPFDTNAFVLRIMTVDYQIKHTYEQPARPIPCPFAHS